MPKTILIVAKDAGGANLVAAWCAENNENRYVFCISGSAPRLFGEILGDVENHSSSELELLVGKVDQVVCGTGDISTEARAAIRLARHQGVPSAMFLDHWFGYRRRFAGSGSKFVDLPDEIWVTDDFAASQAIREGLPEGLIRIMGSPYIDRIARRARELGEGVAVDQKAVLFISEPISKVPELTGGIRDDVGFDEFQMMEDAVAAVQSSGFRTMVLRLHPSEPADQYDELLRGLSTDMEVVVSDERDLAVDLARSIAIIGSNSTALVIGAEAGIRTISYIPEGGRPCVLPHTTIEKVRSRSALVNLLKNLV